MTQLKVLVERAVRPVRASIDRKRKMREELLAHVTAVYEEEARRDVAGALERTAQRFGPPAELTRQLQASVSWHDAPVALIHAFLGVPSTEPVLPRAARYAGMIAVISAASLALMVALYAGWWDRPMLVRLPAIVAPVWMALLVFAAALLEHGMRLAMFGPRGRSWSGMLACGIGAWLLVPAVALLGAVSVSGQLTVSLADVTWLMLSASLAPAALVIVVCACIGEIRYLDEWASLKID
jgi:ATP-dependent Clp protease ATP-binding subunit ClpC